MKNYLDDAVQAICESIRFDSSLSAPLENMPFGKGAADCLAHFLRLAEKLGFATHNYDNYVGEAVWKGGADSFGHSDNSFGHSERSEESHNTQSAFHKWDTSPTAQYDAKTDTAERDEGLRSSEQAIAVLAHLDVVPAGSGWKKAPFAGIVEDGKIWGRGAMDDKGPAIAALYAMKKLKDEGFEPKKTIKLIVGLNEESGWGCMKHYKEVAEMPDYGFTPDANFPVIYAEKGIVDVRFDFPVGEELIESFEGGAQVNMVCDRAEALPCAPANEERARALGLTVENGKLISRGKSAHGSTPEEGKNAVLPLLQYFRLDRIEDCLFKDIYGVKALADETGNLTLSPDIVSYKEGVLSLTCDVRYPSTLPLERVLGEFEKFGVEMEVLSHQPPLYQDKESPFIKALEAVYDDYTGTHHEPVAIGGGTYARALKCGAGFGPEILGEEVTIHQANEYISVERVQMMIDIYSEALRRLT